MFFRLRKNFISLWLHWMLNLVESYSNWSLRTVLFLSRSTAVSNLSWRNSISVCASFTSVSFCIDSYTDDIACDMSCFIVKLSWSSFEMALCTRIRNFVPSLIWVRRNSSLVFAYALNCSWIMATLLSELATSASWWSQRSRKFSSRILNSSRADLYPV